MGWEPRRLAAGPALSGRDVSGPATPALPAFPSTADGGLSAMRPPSAPPVAPAPLPPGVPLGPLRGGYPPAQLIPDPRSPSDAPRTAPPTGERRLLAPPPGGWGDTSLGIEATHAAGLSYLGWWITALVIYFGERQNRFVRFHALQSAIYTGLLTIVSVLAYVVSSLFLDAYLVWHNPFFDTLARGVVLLAVVLVFMAWFVPAIAAWCGYWLCIPYIGAYADRYAAPVEADPGSPST